jgi:hypothetical protein
VAVIRAEPLGWASFGVRLLAGDEEVTELQISTFKGQGSFQLDGESFSIKTEGVFQIRATLKKGSTTVAVAKKTSIWRRRFEVSSAGHRLVLEGRGWSGRSYALVVGKQEVGWVKREGFSGRRVRLEFPDHVPLVLQVFLTYIVVGQARREAAAAAASG